MTETQRLYWRSAEQLAASAEFEHQLHNEFPSGSEPPDAVSRRGFLGVVAAAVAMASTTACRKPVRHIMPFAQRPEDMVPGVPTHYATALSLDGYGTGVLVRSNDGRPTKIEGNRLHPSSLGGASIYAQGEVLDLYDPARSRHPFRGGEAATFADFEAAWKQVQGGLGQGDKLAILMTPTTSPTAEEVLDQVKQRYPKASVHVYAPVHRDAELAGTKLAFGSALDARYDFRAADVVVALDSDFLGSEGNAVRHARDFASRRRPQDDGGADKLNRLYVVEPVPTNTGAQADHRFVVRAPQVPAVAFALAAELGLLQGALADAVAPFRQHRFAVSGHDWVAAMAKDLIAHRGKGIVVAGPRQPAAVHALVHAINAALGNIGGAITLAPTPTLMAQEQVASIRDLAAAMDAGRVETLLVLGGNPVFDAPADLEFAAKLAKVKTSIHVGCYRDETGMVCTWHINGTHWLEAWGDTRAHDGTITIQQPLLAPLFDAHSSIEVLALVAGMDEREGYKLVRYHWEENTKTKDFEGWWKRALRDGVVAGSAPPAVAPTALRDAAIAAAIAQVPQDLPANPSAMDLVFRPHPTIYDGRYANNAWLQECPDPLSKLSWDNAALVNRETAELLGVDSRGVLRIESNGRQMEIPAWIVYGVADNTVVLTLGHGRKLDERFMVARGAGFDTYRLRTSTAQYAAVGAAVSATGRSYDLVTTQDHGSMEERAIYRQASAEEYRKHPSFAPDQSPLAKTAALQSKHTHEGHGEEGGEGHGNAPAAQTVTERDLLKSLFHERDYSQGYQWGMVIDLNACNGCGACVVACQAENNISAVGKDQVAVGREMHWIRIDRYFTGEGHDQVSSAADVVHQPVPCMQCENAPCESVCPVAATTHSPEGLNDMAYNRCIGTRYCGNNCPYKVRRFNFFDFTKALAEPTLQMVQNPDVTVRSRGVMEKCTYCVQRINGAKITAKKQGREVLDGEIVPACGQTCPAQAITFGNIVDPRSAVAKLRDSSLNYALLSERNLKPRTTYLARVRNPNPELGQSS